MINNSNNTSGRFIHFFDSDYRESFTIPDGGFITITLQTGEQLIRACNYQGEYHTEIGGKVYQIHEFAKHLEESGGKCTPCPQPEVVVGYMITDRIPIRDKVFVLAHNPAAPQQWVTWQGKKDSPGYEVGHYWTDKSKAVMDYFNRANAERTGKTYDHTKLYTPQRKHRNER